MSRLRTSASISMTLPRVVRTTRRGPLQSISKPAARMRATLTSVTARAIAIASKMAPPQPTIAGSREATPTPTTAMPTTARCAAVRVG